MKWINFFLLLVIISSCVDKNTSKEQVVQAKVLKGINTKNVKSFQLDTYDFNGFEPFLNKKDDKIYVINFWATWCAPCIKELPYFEKLNTEYTSENIVVVLVSLDFPHLYESKLKPFIIEKKLKSKVIALDDVDMNTWIPKVNENWSGALPATLIYKNDERVFFEKSFTYNELENELKQFLN